MFLVNSTLLHKLLMSLMSLKFFDNCEAHHHGLLFLSSSSSVLQAFCDTNNWVRNFIYYCSTIG